MARKGVHDDTHGLRVEFCTQPHGHYRTMGDRIFPAVENYVDNVMTPASDADALAARMLEYSLPMKPAEPFASTRVVGLQLSKRGDGQTQWSRRGYSDLKLPGPATKHDVFSWCGRLFGHVHVCSWLRPACSYLKRMVNSDSSCDQPISDPLLKLCDELAARLARDGDPACGQWRVSPEESAMYTVWADASDVGIGVALLVDGSVIEDRAWLRPYGDKRHINIVELEAAIRGLSLAVNWQAKHVRLMTDSKTVASWLRDVVGNVRRTKIKGLHEVLMQRRLQIVSDLVITACMDVSVEWVPTAQNRADIVTCVSPAWVK